MGAGAFLHFGACEREVKKYHKRAKKKERK
jgi:hypothetical protein